MHLPIHPHPTLTFRPPLGPSAETLLSGLYLSSSPSAAAPFDLGSSRCPDQTGFVSTGILKDYLRELPTPLITQPLYQVVLEAMAQGPTSRAASGTEGTRELLSCLPEVERVSWVPSWRRPVHPFTHAWPYLARLHTGLESAFRVSHHTGAETGIAGE